MPVTEVELIAKLRDAIEAIRDHLLELNDFRLRAIEASLPRDAPAGSAEMVALILIYRETDKRNAQTSR